MWNCFLTINGNTIDYLPTGTMNIYDGTVIGTGNTPSSSSLSVSIEAGIGQSSINSSASGSWTLVSTPTVSCSITNRTLNTIQASMSVTNNGGSGIVDNYIDLFTDSNCTNLVSTISGTSGTFTGLTPNTTYYARANASNGTFRGYSSVVQQSTYQKATFSSVPNVNIGSSQTITWSNPSGATTTLVLYRTDGTTVINNFGKVTGTSKTYTANADTIYQLTPNSNTYQAKYKLTTTQNGQSYEDIRSFNFNVVNSNPIFTNFEYEDINESTKTLTGNPQILVNGYSNVLATISPSNKATAKNYAEMQRYILAIGDKTATANYSTNEVTMQINNVSNATISITAVDSRTNKTVCSQVAETKNYTKPVITLMTATRSNNGVGEYVTLAFTGTWWNNTFGAQNNQIQHIKYYYKKSDSTGGYIEGTTTITFTTNNGNFSGNIQVDGDTQNLGFDVSSSYYIKLVATDLLDSSQEYILTLGSGTPTMAFYKSNVAIGQKYDTSIGGALQVKGATNIVGNTNITGTTKVTGDVTVNNNNISVIAMNNELKKHLILKHGPAHTGGTEYILLGSLNYIDSSTDNATFIRINGTLGNWATFANIDMVIRNRGGLRVDGTYTGLKSAFSTNSIVIYKQTNNTYKIYLKLTGWYGASDLELSTNQGSIYNSTTKVSPTGTLVKTLDASTLTNLEVYSTDEIRIGTWINNKPIYRKVYNISSISGQDKLIPTGLTTVDEVINLRGIAYKDGDVFIAGTGQYSAGNLWTASLVYLNSSNTWVQNHFYMVFYNNVPNSVKIIFEYTKTTD